MSEKKYKLGTLALHAGHTPDSDTLSRAVPIYATSSFVFRDTEHAANLFGLSEAGNIYSRLSNPTNDILEARLAALDGGVAALTFASGMAAISALALSLAKSGENIVSSSSLYGGTFTLFSHTLKDLGIEVRYFDPTDAQSAVGLIDENTRMIYVESLGNPKNDIPDFDGLAAISREAGVPLAVDNTVLTALAFRPFEAGADIVVYSTTKYIGGHGTHIGGAIIDGGSFDWKADKKRWARFTTPDPSYHGAVFSEVVEHPLIPYIRTHWLRDTGGSMSPFAAWIFLQGLETLHLRLRQHSKNATTVASWLEQHPAVTRVAHNSLPSSPCHEAALRYFDKGQYGAIIGFEIKGGREAGVKFINAVKLASHLANIGDAKTLVIHPASTTHQQLDEKEQLAAGVTPSYIRLCVGIEDVEDIVADLDQALEASQK